MSMSDPIADMLTRIRNAQHARKAEVLIPFSKMKESIAKVLEEEGYIESLETTEVDGFKQIKIVLRYIDDKPSILSLRRVSRPGLRVYRKADELPVAMNGFGTVIISTSKGVISDRNAKRDGHGGEVVCIVE